MIATAAFTASQITKTGQTHTALPWVAQACVCVCMHVGVGMEMGVEVSVGVGVWVWVGAGRAPGVALHSHHSLR